VLALPLEQVSIKMRAGGPLDDGEDLGLPHWAGVLPLRLAAQAPVPDQAHPPLGAVPEALSRYARR
jgi:hypothetical protein